MPDRGVPGGDADHLPLVIDDLAGVPTTLGYVTTVFDSHCETRLELDHRHSNRNGRLHGGILATVLDAAMGFSASRAFAKAEGLTTDETDVLTLSMTTNFVGATEGRVVTATGRIDRHGRSVAFASGQVHDEDGVLLATASATFKRTRSRGKR